jgi:hypothetical protein
MLYAVTILLSAFLLFQVQPIIAETILPWFGGAAAVWTLCVLFFQLLLVAGYLYAHWSIRALRPRPQSLVHIAALAGGLAALPILPDATWKPIGEADPSVRILGLLAASIGVPYFLLATTSPLLQAWYARTREGAAPYRLYALSNFGSKPSDPLCERGPAKAGATGGFQRRPDIPRGINASARRSARPTRPGSLSRPTRGSRRGTSRSACSRP